MAKNDLLIIVAVGLVVAVVLGVIPLGTQSVNVSPITIGGQKQNIQCTSNVSPELQVKLFDSIAGGTERTDVNGSLYLNGNYSAKQTLSTDATFDAAAGDAYVIYLTGSTNNTTRFGKILTGTVPCQELTVLGDTIDTVGTPTLQAFNGDDDLINSATDALALGSGETASFRLRVKENTADAWVSPTHSNAPAPIMVVDANFASIFSSVRPAGSYSATEVPEGHTVPSYATASKAYIVNETKGLKDFAYADIQMQAEAKSGVNPSDQNFLVTLYQPQLIQDTDTGAWVWAYRNPVGGAAIITGQTVKVVTS